MRMDYNYNEEDTKTLSKNKSAGMSLLPNYYALLLFLLLLWLQQYPCLVLGRITKHEKHRFIESCPPSPCGSLEIRFPLRLRTSPAYCGLVGLDLACQGNTTLLLSLPSSSSSSNSPLRVTAIDYRYGQLTVDLGSSPPCPLRNLSFLSSPTYMLAYYDYDFGIGLLSCTKEIHIPGNDSSWNQVAGPIACLSDSNHFGYAISLWADINSVPPECTMTSKSHFNNSNFQFCFQRPDTRWDSRPSLKEMVEDISERRQAKLWWSYPDYSTQYCADQCELRGKMCGFSWGRNVSFCFNKNHNNHRSTVMIIAGTSTAGVVVLLSVLAILLYISRKSEKERETRLKVERFLATYKTTKPKRYTFSELKKITKQLRHKLGQGGFGSVYKGELPNGVPVAIKMLETSKGKGDEFINEVATIGKIHHVNVVRLLGFCSEGTRHALIYEFMPNGSLEKFIFLEDDARSRRGNYEPLTVEKLLEIAIGIAGGIEYLHQGCDQRILHFDIKPHNILLDHDFSPKISDFGLAKLCSRDHSIVTMTAARGTMGYIAPEMYSRNFGTVSYKSDVYSFGMLLMEMVSGRKNVDPVIENLELQKKKMEESDVYFPEWVYDQLITGADIGILSMGKKKATEEDTDEEEIVKKLLIVAFWCIQWNPTDRPTMTRVIQLLMEDLESSQIPPKPFISPNQQDNDSSSTTNQV